VLTEAINWINLAVNNFLLPAFNVEAHIVIFVAAGAAAATSSFRF
jgi:hypothetical protein